MAGPSTEYTKSTLPVEAPAVPVASQPWSDIETHYNSIIRSIRELWACINGAATGGDINGNQLADFSTLANMGLLPRLVDIEDSGRINDSSSLNVGASLSAGDRALRAILGSLAVYSEIAWDNTNGVWVCRDQTAALKRMQGATPTASHDFTTKQYVDGILGGGSLRKLAICANPAKTASQVMTMDYYSVADSSGLVFLSSTTSKTAAINVAGLGGIMTSTASKGVNGTITVSNGSPTVTGSSTTFLADYVVGDWIRTPGGQNRKITVVTDNVTMTVSVNFSANEAGVAHYRGGVNAATSTELNLYVVGDAIGINTGLAYSSRNTNTGQTVVDLPTVLKTGTATCTSATNTLVGVGTLFLTEFVVGQEIVIAGSSVTWATISEITSDTSLKISGTWAASVSAGQVRLSYNKYRLLSFAAPVNASNNLHDFLVTGFPWATRISLTASDGTSDFGLVANSTTTSTTALNTWTSLKVPRNANRVYLKSYAVATSNTVVPGYFNIGPTTGNVSLFTTPCINGNYNGLSNWYAIVNNAYVWCDLDSSGNFQYKSDANVTGGITVLGFEMGGWKG